MNILEREVLALAADNLLFQVKNAQGLCTFRRGDGRTVSQTAVQGLIAGGLIGDLGGWEPHTGGQVRRLLYLSEAGLDVVLGSAGGR